MTLYLPDLVGLAGLLIEALFVLKYWAWLAAPWQFVTLAALSLLILACFRTSQQLLGEDHAVTHWADWWVALGLLPFYLNLNQMIDAVGRPLLDDWLIAVDQRLFGVQPAVWFSFHMQRWLTEWLFLAYTCYFACVALTGIMLSRLRDRRPFHAYVCAVGVSFTVQMFGYIIVPAVGPRFAQLSQMGGSLDGFWLAHDLDQSFKRVTFLRDCFPSGHTLQTLVAMYFALRYLSKRYAAFMWFMGVSIITATLYCRMHYAFDLVAAAPIALLSTVFCEELTRRARGRFYLPVFAKYAMKYAVSRRASK